MKILQQNLEGNGSGGTIKMVAEESDDMYHLYNLIEIGDIIHSTTIRMVTTESKTGARDKTRLQVSLLVPFLSITLI
jgi:protein pelota